MKADDKLTVEECKAIVLAMLTAAQHDRDDLAAEIAGLAADPARLRKILAGGS